jgi:hypothetical protein
MMSYLWLAIGFAALAFFGCRAVRIGLDSRRWGFPSAHRLGWALCGAIVPSRYWWDARIDALPPHEREALLACETEALGLDRADSLRCPLCKAEVPHAWAIGSEGRPTIARRRVECPDCDFRLDACRHCSHFLPGAPRGWGQAPWDHDDRTFGRCAHYKTYQPAEQACAPDMARRLEERGHDRVRAPRPIVDSFLPPDACSAFKADRRWLRAGGIRWPDARRVALLRLLAPSATPAAPAPAEAAQDDEQWLL